MAAASQHEKALAFRRLHAGPSILILPNAWDVASARIFELAGFSAIGTTSAGIAASLGYPDGERISRDEMIEVIRRMAAGVALPVSADIESGYGATPEAVAETVTAVIAAGAVGVNLEDATGRPDQPLRDISLQVERLQAAREAVAASGVPIVINARTDVYWLQVGEAATRLDHALRRTQAYRAAGADCLFIPGVRESEEIATLVRELAAPVNVIAGRGVPPIPELARLGVARLSVGSGPIRATLTYLRQIAAELLGPGTYTAMTEGTITYDELNKLF